IPTRALLTPSGRPSTITPPPCSSSLLSSLLYASSPLTPLSAPRAPVAPYTLPSPPPLCRPPHDTTSRSAPCAGRDHATAPAPTTAAAAVAAASDYAHYPRLSPEDVAPPTPAPYHAAAALLGQSLRLLPRRRRRTRLQEYNGYGEECSWQDGEEVRRGGSQDGVPQRPGLPPTVPPTAGATAALDQGRRTSADGPL
ncbi:Os05g0226300, partial [Oryza sativa Japonica Group]